MMYLFQSYPYRKALIVVSCLLWGMACRPPTQEVADDDVLLAKVHNQSLYLSELEALFPVGGSKQDSLLFLNAYVERWVRNRLLLHEAELNIPNDVNIDALVRDYRATLVLHNYEQKIAENELDSTITEEQIRAFYEKNKDAYQLQSPIFRATFVKIPVTAPNLNEVPAWWKSTKEEDELRLVNYCATNAEIYHLNENRWFEPEQIAKHLPKDILTDQFINTQKNYQHQDENYLYLLKILEVVSNNQALPLGYIENRAKKVILQQRKNKLIEQKKETLYERETARNNVQIFIQK